MRMVLIQSFEDLNRTKSWAKGDFWLLAGTGALVFCPGTGIYPIGSPGAQALGAVCDYIISYSGSPACQLWIWGLLSLFVLMTQFLLICLSVLSLWLYRNIYHRSKNLITSFLVQVYFWHGRISNRELKILNYVWSSCHCIYHEEWPGSLLCKLASFLAVSQSQLDKEMAVYAMEKGWKNSQMLTMLSPIRRDVIVRLLELRLRPQN